MAFLTDDFLLSTDTAKALYHKVAAKMPIYDYHCHIDAKDIYENRSFGNLFDIWLEGDHYKWRVMRSNGVPERYITGDAEPKEKFRKFAQALPRAIGNPMYHWCHLELKNYFGYDGALSGDTADEVWDIAAKKLAEPNFTARELIKCSNVKLVGTTDDPISDLKYHKLLAESDFSIAVCPTFRPDNAFNLHKSGFADYIAKLEIASETEFKSADDVKAALSKRIEYFVSCGCKASDHGLDYIIFRPASDDEVNEAFCKAMRGEPLSKEEIESYQTAMLLHCASEYKRLGLVMQIHFSCMRNPNTRRFNELGPDSGFDCIAVTDSCAALHRLMNALDANDILPRTILYSLNPADDEWLDSLIGAYQSDEIAGKIQHGSAWWFNDNKTGMQKQLISLANLGILGNFIGMLTDSRSLLSYARHEYFRRILCDLIGKWVENGEYPNDFDALSGLVADICADNAKRYFNM